jgi:oligopeptidase B
LVILTNLDAEDFRVMTAPVAAPGMWTELVAHEAGRRITSVEAFEGFLLLSEWADALQRLRLLFADGSTRVLAFDDEVHGVESASNPEYTTTTIRFTHESYTAPPSVLEEDVRTGERRLLKRHPVLGDFDPERYVTERTWAPSTGNARVAVDVTRRREVPVDGTAPAVLYGYGAYELSLPPWFSIARLSLLDRGVVFAVAHVRGGGEGGRRWYLDGKLERKQHSFDDLRAAVTHLVAGGWAAPHRVAIRGGSAGGLLVGAVLTQAPELLAGVLAEVPFVDVVTTMSDPSLPLTVTEWEEWGDPRTPEGAQTLAAYSPYDNVGARRYPPVLLTAGLNDPRVGYQEPAKLAAKLRAVAPEGGPYLLVTELGAGHRGPTGRYGAWRDEARNLAFLLHATGTA